MIPSADDRKRIFDQAYIAAISGLSTQPDLTAKDIAEKAAQVAYHAVSEYRHELSKRNEF